MPSKLTQYKKKHNLKKSGEPKTKVKKPEKKSSKKLVYVIHKHHATNLHYDFRLEINGTLKSWAVPKTLPKTKGIKRLAIQVEDHPLEYAKFKGIIPKGNYGAGKVEIWDKGTYKLEDKKPNKIVINLHGKKLKGRYVLVKTAYGKNKKGWLFMKI